MSYPPSGPPTGPPPGQPPGLGRPSHPQATTVLVLGILGLLLCQLVGPFAWKMGNQVVREIDASGGQYDGREMANIGRILGIVATVLLVVTVAIVILGALAVFLVAGVTTVSSTSTG